ncbi:hypothetical protein DL770_010437 [Monosporascus sp. CRB-9-2]|nr:hypothetical protein DL770_010437 [Monosporascus sp. CRB-9-2]
MLLLPVELIAEYAKQPEDVVSFDKYVREVMHAKYSLFGDNMLDNNIQKPIVRKELLQKLRYKIDMMNGGVVAALTDTLTSQMDENGGIKINVWDTAMKFLSRTSNRIICGYPLCRNEEFLEATIDYAVNMFSLAVYVRFIPPFLRPCFLDLVGLPKDVFDETVADLRTEISSALREAGGYNADFVSKLDFMDSFYRESLRANPVGDTDTKYYPGGFNPRRALEGPACPKATNLTPDFLIFGLGRPALSRAMICGTLQKLAMSHILMDYDIECLGERPPGLRKVALVGPRDRTRRIVLRKRSLD